MALFLIISFCFVSSVNSVTIASLIAVSPLLTLGIIVRLLLLSYYNIKKEKVSKHG